MSRTEPHPEVDSDDEFADMSMMSRSSLPGLRRQPQQQVRHRCECRANPDRTSFRTRIYHPLPLTSPRAGVEGARQPVHVEREAVQVHAAEREREEARGASSPANEAQAGVQGAGGREGREEEGAGASQEVPEC
jgi:hypothetical protein